jgi:nucleoside-diphosphate-sugar epimerase
MDLNDPRSFGTPPAAFDYLFYTASADRRDEDAYRAIYVDGLRNLWTALRDARCKLRRVLFTSSTAVYGQSKGEWVDESSVTEPRSFNGRILLEAEALVREAPETGINLRLSGIYGPGRTRLVQKVWSGQATATDSWTNRIHVDDCAGALHQLMRVENPHSLYLGSDDHPATTAEVVAWLSNELRVAAPPRAEAGQLNKRCRTSRLRDTGYRLAYPTYREGYGPIVREFLSQTSVDRWPLTPSGE